MDVHNNNVVKTKSAKVGLLVLAVAILSLVNFVGAVGTYPAVDPSMVLYYHFNNDSAFQENDTFVYDYSGNGNNGTANNTQFIPNSGIFNDGSLRFNEVNSSIKKGGINLNLSDGITFSLWFNATNNKSGAPDMILFGVRNSSGVNSFPQIYLGERDVSGSSQMKIRVFINQTCDMTSQTTGFAKNDSKWHSLIGTYNGSTLEIYIDGILNNSNTINSGCRDLSKTLNYVNYNISVGGDISNISGSFFNGMVDEVSLWNKTLNKLEILRLYQSYYYQGFDIIHINACGNLTKSRTRYILDNEVTSNSSCFHINNTFIELDGNGHKIIYANGSGIIRNSRGIWISPYVQTDYFYIHNATIIEGTNISNVNSNFAILAWSTSNGLIEDNNITTNTYGSMGVYLHYQSDNNTIRNNHINVANVDTDAYAISTDSSRNVLISNNTMNCKLSICMYLYDLDSDSARREIDNLNSVGGLPVNYTDGLNNISIENEDYSIYGLTIFTNMNNLTIKNTSLSLRGTLFDFGKNLSIINSFVDSKNSKGIDLHNIEGFSLINNTIITQNSSGIFADTYSRFGNISDNNISVYGFKSYGIYLFQTNQINIVRNIIYGDELGGRYVQGIELDGDAQNNTINYNNITIINGHYSAYGIFSLGSSNNTFSSNTIKVYGSIGYGIALSTYNARVDKNYFFRNDITCPTVGIFIEEGTTNSIFNETEINTTNIWWRFKTLNSNITIIKRNIRTNYSIVNFTINGYSDFVILPDYQRFDSLASYDTNGTLRVNGSLIYYSNGSVACSNINSCNGNINITLTPNNYSYVLDNFNLTEGVSRQFSPVWFTASSNTQKRIASNLTQNVNVPLIFNVDNCDTIGNIYLTPKDSAKITYQRGSYSCSNNQVTISSAQLNPSTESNVIDIEYSCSTFTRTGFNLVMIFASLLIIIFLVYNTLKWKE